HFLEQETESMRFRRIVQDVLSRPPSTLSRHKSILKLARSDHGTGRVRLVTTNFDTLFEQADKEVQFEAAPRIAPLDRDRWNGIVYLHGRIPPSGNGDGADLVLTSGDFGKAYLRERWASRFVSELFATYSVIFIGYSAEDHVIRYLLDAFSKSS